MFNDYTWGITTWDEHLTDLRGWYNMFNDYTWGINTWHEHLTDLRGWYNMFNDYYIKLWNISQE
jgi:hypothetical protein